MRLGSGVAEAVVEAGSCISDWTPGLGTSICRMSGPKKQKIKIKIKIKITQRTPTIFKFKPEFPKELQLTFLAIKAELRGEKKKSRWEFTDGLSVKDSVLSLVWLRLLLWLEFDPWPGNFFILWA